MPNPIINRLLRRKGGVRPPPVTSGLILQNDSYDFDRSVAGSNLTAWADKSGNGHNWANGTNNVIVEGQGDTASTPPTVDKTRTAGGHATVRFAGGPSPQWFKQAIFFGAAGFTGLEVFCVFKRDADPPASAPNAGGPFQFVHPLASFPNHEPFTDSHIYEGFGRTDRPDCGNPTTDLSTAFRVYNVSSASSGALYDIFIDNENLLHQAGAGYTFSQQGAETFDNFYFLGLGERYGVSVYMFQGNIACCYVYNRQLTAAERALMRVYFTSVYGTAA